MLSPHSRDDRRLVEVATTDTTRQSRRGLAWYPAATTQFPRIPRRQPRPVWTPNGLHGGAFQQPRGNGQGVQVYETRNFRGGGQGRNRTADASLFRAALYQLSYLAGKFQFSKQTGGAGAAFTLFPVPRALLRSPSPRRRASCCRARPWSRWRRSRERAGATWLREFRIPSGAHRALARRCARNTAPRRRSRSDTPRPNPAVRPAFWRPCRLCPL